MKRRRKVRTLTAWRGAVGELLAEVDRKVRDTNGRDPGQGTRPKETTIRCEVYAPSSK